MVQETEALTIDEDAWTAQLSGQPVRLTYREFRLLAFLAEHPGKVFQRADLLRHVWQDNMPRSSHEVDDLYVHRLRQKLGDFGRRAIHTIVRVGYRFDVKDLGNLDGARGTLPDRTAE